MPKAKFTAEEFEKAVLRLKTFSNTQVGKVLGVDRATVWRFIRDNPDVVEQVKIKLASIEQVRYDGVYISNESFKELPIIQEWIELMTLRRASERYMLARVNNFYSICKYLKVSPSKITPEQSAELVIIVRQWEGRHKEDAPKEYRGLSYYSLRKTLRSFFSLVHGISGERLTGLQIDAGRSINTGSRATERVTQHERVNFIKSIPDAIRWVQENQSQIKGIKTIRWDEDIRKIIEIEVKGIAYFMYYSATRISATHNVKLNDSLHIINPIMWEIHVLDKGKRGGIDWQKRLMDDAIIKMQWYINARFGIPIDEIKDTIKDMDEYLFPWIHENPRHEVAVMKKALQLAGNKGIEPNHIWRHSYAQDSLKATRYNYELCAEIGGWKDTNTMKLSYGEMDEDTIQDGLRLIMGLPVEEKEKRFLKW